MTIRRDIGFESASCKLMIDNSGEDYFRKWINKCFKSTDEQLKKLQYQ